MLDRDKVLETIDEAYVARVRGDKEALARCWAEGASFKIAGNPAPFKTLCFETNQPMNAISDLIDRFEFSDLERISALVEGNQAAIRWEVTVTAHGSEPIRTELLDLVELGDDGRIRSFVQFADTASILTLLQDEDTPAF
ncbi:MAG: nuclear transport factor 2 family protein [Sphingobium sp.]|nr:nuclear transport factor 2 family protein [Sphingobium sp.]